MQPQNNRLCRFTCLWYPALVARLQIGADVIDFDVVSREDPEYPATATEHAVEQGAALVDHLRPGSLTIQVEAVITDKPIRAPSYGTGGAQTVVGASLTFDREFDRVGAVVARLRAAQVGAELCVWTGRLGRVENIVVQNFRPPFTSALGTVMSLSLRQIRVAEVRRVAIPQTLQDRGQARRDRGKQPPVEAPAPKRESLAARIVGYSTSVIP